VFYNVVKAIGYGSLNGAYGNEQGDYFSASPCNPIDLQQDDLERILLNTAIQKGFKVRFDTKFKGLSSTGEAEKETQESLIEDMVTGQTITVRSKFIVAADGAYGSIMPQLEVPRKDLGPGGASLYVHVEADLVRFRIPDSVVYGTTCLQLVRSSLILLISVLRRCIHSYFRRKIAHRFHTS
jgi:hypothetical protein